MTLALQGKSRNRQWLLVAFALLAVFGAITATLVAQKNAFADHPVTGIEGVAPQPFSGNATILDNPQKPEDSTCQDLGTLIGYTSGSTPVSGTYAIGDGSVTIDTDGYHLDFTSTVFIIGVYVKSSNGGNFYDYTADPTAADTDLWGDVNTQPDPDVTQQISHVVFCSNGDPVTSPSGLLSVEKTAALTYERTCTWDVDKTSDTASISAAPNTPYTIHYTVTVTGDCTDDTTGTVSGTIVVTNIGDLTVNDIDISDSMLGAVIDNCVESGGGAFDGSLDPDEYVTCDYTVEGVALLDGSNTATATGTDTDDNALEADDTAEWTVPSEPSVIHDRCTTVDDTNAAGPQDLELCSTGTGPQSPTPIEYDVNGNTGEVGCTAYNVDNTATLSTGGSDTVSIPVTVTCVPGKTQGYWGNKNGQDRIAPGFTYTLGTTSGCHVDVTKDNSKIVLPGLKTGHDGLSIDVGCTVSKANAGAFNNLLSQTLALRLNQLYVSGFNGQTINGLNCASYIGATGLSGSSNIQQVLDAANALIGISGAGPVGDFNALLGCMNREAL